MDYVETAKQLSDKLAQKMGAPYISNVGVKINAGEMLINVLKDSAGLLTFMLLNGPEDGLTVAKYHPATGVASVEGASLTSIKGLTSVIEEYVKYEAQQREARVEQERKLEQQAAQEYQQKQQQPLPQQPQALTGAVQQPQSSPQSGFGPVHPR